LASVQNPGGTPIPLTVIPAQAGIQWRRFVVFAVPSRAWGHRDNSLWPPLDSGLRRNDGEG